MTVTKLRLAILSVEVRVNLTPGPIKLIKHISKHKKLCRLCLCNVYMGG